MANRHNGPVFYEIKIRRRGLADGDGGGDRKIMLTFWFVESSLSYGIECR